jgi:hypothetical protein
VASPAQQPDCNTGVKPAHTQKRLPFAWPKNGGCGRGERVLWCGPGGGRGPRRTAPGFSSDAPVLWALPRGGVIPTEKYHPVLVYDFV